MTCRPNTVLAAKWTAKCTCGQLSTLVLLGPRIEVLFEGSWSAFSVHRIACRCSYLVIYITPSRHLAQDTPRSVKLMKRKACEPFQHEPTDLHTSNCGGMFISCPIDCASCSMNREVKARQFADAMWSKTPRACRQDPLQLPWCVDEGASGLEHDTNSLRMHEHGLVCCRKAITVAVTVVTVLTRVLNVSYISSLHLTHSYTIVVGFRDRDRVGVTAHVCLRSIAPEVTCQTPSLVRAKIVKREPYICLRTMRLWLESVLFARENPPWRMNYSRKRCPGRGKWMSLAADSPPAEKALPFQLKTQTRVSRPGPREEASRVQEIQ
eukprot:1156756-Pelagomonas_calceolata.AAC.1